MKFEIKQSISNIWIIGIWCAFGTLLTVIAVLSYWIRKCRASAKKLKKVKDLRRASSANEFDFTALTAANKRQIFSRHRSASSEQENSDFISEHSEKSPLVHTRIDNLAKLFFNKSLPIESGIAESVLERPATKYQYTALDSGSGITSKNQFKRNEDCLESEREKELAFEAGQQWTLRSNGRYEIIRQLNNIGSRETKNWFLVGDSTIRTNRLMTLLPLPQNCVALQELPSYENPKDVLMELLGSLHHPYIYPVLDIDLGFLSSNTKSYACLVMPFNPRGSLKDLLHKSNCIDPWNLKYERSACGLPINQVQILGRQILEALLFLKERGFPSHGHLHSGNVILQNGVARLSGLENGLLGLKSNVNAVIWSQSEVDNVEDVDIICFGHLLYEMCVGYELDTPKPSLEGLAEDLRKYPQVLEILTTIFYCEIYPTLEDLVLCDWFRGIDLRELRGPCISTIKPSLSKSSLNLLEAVKKRQTVSIHNLISHTSFPCTPPTTPSKLRAFNSYDDSSDDSEGVLDEIIVTSSYESHHYDPLQSPIHFCDNSIQSDDNSGKTSVAEIVTEQHEENNIIYNSQLNTTAPNQLTTEMCNQLSTEMRKKYSLKCLKFGKSNPSQDSAFGSLSESVASSSFVRSFQSISSPIDEGVEDILISTISPNNEVCLELKTLASQNDSAISTPSRDYSTNLLNSESTNRSLSISPKRTRNSSSTSNLQFDPPKILVNDSYTTSPSKGSNLELFTQKYRISSFEDISPSRKNLRSVNKVAFRSLEEERRIDKAFIPIKDRTNSENKVSTYSNIERFNKLQKLTHSTFCGIDTRRNSVMWKDNILYHKAKIDKSNESLYENTQSISNVSLNNLQDNQPRCSSAIGESSKTKLRQQSDKYLFNLANFKQTAITDCVSDEESFNDNNINYFNKHYDKPSTSGSSINSSNSNPNVEPESSDDATTSGSPSAFFDEEEKTPLLHAVADDNFSPNESSDVVM